MSMAVEGRMRGIRGEGMNFGIFGMSVRLRGGRRGVGRSSWMGGVRAPCCLVAWMIRGRGKG